MDIRVKSTNNFHKHYGTASKIVISQGGGRSGKTFSILQIFILLAVNSKSLLLSVVAENVPFLKRGAIRDFKTIMEHMGIWVDDNWNRTDSNYDFGNGSSIEFFSADNAGKAVGAARDYLFINEANNVKYEIAFQLMARTNERTFIDFNPVAEFWAHTEILNNPAFDGQVDYVHSTFIDNEELSDSIKQTMLSRAAIDKNYETVYIKGEVGSLEGLIFPNINLVDAMPEDSGRAIYGLDFGYSQDPTSLIAVLKAGDKLYFDELIYQTGLRNSDINALMQHHKVNSKIYADSAEPKTIDDLYLMGWNIHPVIKGKDSIMWGIDLMKQHHIHITKRSTNLIKEFRNYTYDKDKEGKMINKPIGLYDHGIDAARYAVMMLQRNKHDYQSVDTYTENRRL